MIYSYSRIGIGTYIEMIIQPKLATPKEISPIDIAQILVTDISQLIEDTRLNVAREFNSAQIKLCWVIGNRINSEILQSQKAQYGEQIINHIAKELTLKYGRGFDSSKLFRMVKFTRLFTNSKIVAILSQQLSWSHFVLLIAIEDQLKRDFYAEMSRVSNWSVRKLKAQVDGMLYERTAIRGSSHKTPEFPMPSNLLNLINQTHC